MAPGTLTIAFPLGVTVGKWTRVFEERHPDVLLSVVKERPEELRARLDSGDVDLAFDRLPIEIDGLHVIPLYEENVVAAMHHEHVLTLEKTLQLADLDGETILEPAVGDEWDEVLFRRVAAGDGVAVVPQSVAKALRRRDVVAMKLEDAEPARVALAWPREAENPMVDEFIGIVRGRSARSSRNPEVAAAEAADAKKLAAVKAAKASQAAKDAKATKAGSKGAAKAGAKGPAGTARRTPSQRGSRGQTPKRGRRR